MNFKATTPRTYLTRLLLALCAAFVLVASASIAVGGRNQNTHDLVSGSIAILAISLPAAGISAFVARRDLSVVFLAQALTIGTMAVLQFWFWA